jgi:hypothetical protein
MRTHYLRFHRTYHTALRWRFFVGGALLGLGVLLIWLSKTWIVPLITIPNDRIISGVTINTVEVGELSLSQATTKLRSQLPLPTPGNLTLNWRDPQTGTQQQWATAAASLGYHFGVTETLDEAMKLGHTGPIWQQLRDRWNVSRQGKSLTISPLYDEQRLASWLQQVSKKVQKEGRQPTVKLSGGTYSIDKGVAGWQLNQKDLIFHFRRSDTTLLCGDNIGNLHGLIKNGMEIKGSDQITFQK